MKLPTWLLRRVRRNNPRGVQTQHSVATGGNYSLDALLLKFGSDPDSFWTIEDACSGTAIFGATGSGKTSGSGQAIARSLLTSEAVAGGIVNTVKADPKDGDRALWERYASETNREDSMIYFSPNGEHRFNFMNFALSMSEGGVVENLSEMFMVIAKAGTKTSAQGAGGEDSQFWDDCLRMFLRATISLLSLTIGTISLDLMLNVARSVPNDPSQVHDETWQKSSFLFDLICQGEAKKQRGELGNLSYDFDMSASYFLTRLPDLGDKTRGSIIVSFESLADSLLREPLRSMFCTDTTIRPEMTWEDDKIIVLDLPVHKWGIAGSRGQAAFLYLWQRACENRDLSQNDKVVFWLADEAAHHVSADFTPLFLSTCRGLRVASILLAQNFNSYLLAFGSRQGQEATRNILGNCRTRIYHANLCETTNEAAAASIGKEFITIEGGGTSAEISGSRSFNSHTHQVFEYPEGATPRDYTVLSTGGQRNRYLVEAVVTIAGRKFKDGRTFLKTTFPQIYGEVKP